MVMLFGPDTEQYREYDGIVQSGIRLVLVLDEAEARRVGEQAVDVRPVPGAARTHLPLLRGPRFRPVTVVIQLLCERGHRAEV